MIKNMKFIEKEQNLGEKTIKNKIKMKFEMHFIRFYIDRFTVF